MRKFLLATASLLAITLPAFAQEIETPFGGIHGPIYTRPHRDYSERWNERRWHHEHEWRHHHHHHWDDDED